MPADRFEIQFRPTEVSYSKADKRLTVTWDDGKTFVYPAEYLEPDEFETALAHKPGFALMLMSMLIRRLRETIAQLSVSGALAQDDEFEDAIVFDRKQLQQLAAGLADDPPIYFQQGAQIIAKGQTGIRMYAVIEGEVAVKLAAMPISMVPPRAISDQTAADFVRTTVESFFGDGGEAPAGVALAYAPGDGLLRELGIVEPDDPLSGIAQNVSIVPKTTRAQDAGLGRAERFVSMRDGGTRHSPPWVQIMPGQQLGARSPASQRSSMQAPLTKRWPLGQPAPSGSGR